MSNNTTQAPTFTHSAPPSPPMAPFWGNIFVPGTDWPVTDNQPMDSDWQAIEIELLRDSLYQLWGANRIFYAAGNLFIHFDPEQRRNRQFLGPDFFVALGVPTRLRKYYAVWEEGGNYPDLIVELLSPSTRYADLTYKKRVYETVFQTPDYFCFDPNTLEFFGWRLHAGTYQPLQPNDQGRLWSGATGLWLGPWDGTVLDRPGTWLRFFTPQGALVLTQGEAAHQRAEAEKQRAEAEQLLAETEKRRADAEQQRADAEQQRADAEKHRADSLAAELAILKAKLSLNSNGVEGQ